MLERKDFCGNRRGGQKYLAEREAHCSSDAACAFFPVPFWRRVAAAGI
jgi:hypothetical protein